MLQRETGKVVHIDFGDCFEVAMMREKFPEKVPFRLTRMIIGAMEVGFFRTNFSLVSLPNLFICFLHAKVPYNYIDNVYCLSRQII